jgi:hypothetical protein
MGIVAQSNEVDSRDGSVSHALAPRVVPLRDR